MRAVFVVLLVDCWENVDSLVMDFHYIQKSGVGWVWWVKSTDITGFFDSAFLAYGHLYEKYEKSSPKSSSENK